MAWVSSCSVTGEPYGFEQDLIDGLVSGRWRVWSFQQDYRADGRIMVRVDLEDRYRAMYSQPTYSGAEVIEPRDTGIEPEPVDEPEDDLEPDSEPSESWVPSMTCVEE